MFDYLIDRIRSLFVRKRHYCKDCRHKRIYDNKPHCGHPKRWCTDYGYNIEYTLPCSHWNEDGKCRKFEKRLY